MTKATKILFQGTSEVAFLPVLEKFGIITFYTGEEDLNTFDLVIFDGASDHPDWEGLITWGAKDNHSLGIYNVTGEQLGYVASCAAVSPLRPVTGILLGGIQDKGTCVKFLYTYSQEKLSAISAITGKTEAGILEGLVYSGVAQFLNNLEQKRNVSVTPFPPLNNLVPNSSNCGLQYAPYFHSSFTPQTVSATTSGLIENVTTTAMILQSDLYCYQEPVSNTDATPLNYVVIVITGASSVGPCGPLYQSQAPPIPSCSDYNEVDYYNAIFSYNVSIQISDANLKPIAFPDTTNFSLYPTSPTAFDGNTITDSQNLTIDMTGQNTAGDYVNVTFQAGYTHEFQDTTYYQYFQANTLDDAANGIAGVQFAIPASWQSSTENAYPTGLTAFEVISAFRIPVSFFNGSKDHIINLSYPANQLNWNQVEVQYINSVKQIYEPTITGSGGSLYTFGANINLANASLNNQA